MLIQEEFVIQADRLSVAAFLSDAERVSTCVPGVEDLVSTGDDAYSATLAIRVGPIKTRFVGRVELDRSGVPERLEATITGRDRNSGTSVNVRFTADLEETPSDSAVWTTVDTTADVSLRGRLAQFGGGVIKATASEMVREFATGVNQQVLAEPPGAVASGSIATFAGPVTAVPRTLTLGRLVRLWVRRLFRSVLRRGRGVTEP